MTLAPDSNICCATSLVSGIMLLTDFSIYDRRCKLFLGLNIHNEGYFIRSAAEGESLSAVCFFRAFLGKTTVFPGP